MTNHACMFGAVMSTPPRPLSAFRPLTWRLFLGEVVIRSRLVFLFLPIIRVPTVMVKAPRLPVFVLTGRAEDLLLGLSWQ